MPQCIPIPLHAHSPLRLIRSEDPPPYDAVATPTPIRSEGFGMIRHPSFDKIAGDGYAIAVYAVLVRHANRDGVCWPSVESICKSVGWSKKIVVAAIKRLVDAGVVVKEKRQINGMDQSNLYRIVGTTANVQVVPTEPPVVPTGTLGGSHSTTELDTSELDNVPPLPPKKPLPENGDAQRIVAAYCRAAGIEQPAVYRKAVGQAQQLAKAGVSPEDIPALYEWRSSKAAMNGGAEPVVTDWDDPVQREAWRKYREQASLRRL
jgi:hypothetical protein